MLTTVKLKARDNRRRSRQYGKRSRLKKLPGENNASKATIYCRRKVKRLYQRENLSRQKPGLAT